jgi:hypothetical protein
VAKSVKKRQINTKKYKKIQINDPFLQKNMHFCAFFTNKYNFFTPFYEHNRAKTPFQAQYPNSQYAIRHTQYEKKHAHMIAQIRGCNSASKLYPNLPRLRNFLIPQGGFCTLLVGVLWLFELEMLVWLDIYYAKAVFCYFFSYSLFFGF